MSIDEHSRSPYIWRRVLRAFLPSGIRGEAIRGDLDEEFAARRRAGGPAMPADGIGVRPWDSWCATA